MFVAVKAMQWIYCTFVRKETTDLDRSPDTNVICSTSENVFVNVPERQLT